MARTSRSFRGISVCSWPSARNARRRSFGRFGRGLMMTQGARRAAGRAGVLLGLLISLPSWGCKGGGDEASAAPCTDITFTAADTTPASGDVFMSQTGSTCTTLQVSVVVNDLSGILTVGFDMTYPAALSQYTSYTVGPLMQKNGSTPIVLVTGGSGTVKVAVSRVMQDGPVNALSNEVLITLHFSKVGAGTGTIDFDSSQSSTVDEEVLDQNGTARPASFGPNHGGIVMVP